MRKIFATIITLLLALSLVLPASAQNVDGIPVVWGKPNTQIKFTPSKYSNDMETDSVLITFISTSAVTPITYEIVIRGEGDLKAPVIESGNRTITDESNSFYLEKNQQYTIKLEGNTLVIVNSNGNYAAKFDLIKSDGFIDDFKSTTRFVYGECDVKPAGKINLLKNDNVVEGPHPSASPNETPTKTENLPSNQPPISETKPADNEAGNTSVEDGDKKENSVGKTLLYIFLVILVLAVVAFGVILIIRQVNGKKREQEKLHHDNTPSSENIQDTETTMKFFNHTSPNQNSPSDVYSHSDVYAPSEPTPIDIFSDMQSPSDNAAPQRSAEFGSMFSEEKISSRWASATDIHLLDFAENVFNNAPAIINVSKVSVPSAQQTPATPVAPQAPATPAAPVAPQAPVTPQAPVAPVQEKTPANEASAFSVIYEVPDGVNQLRTALNSYDAVKFAEVLSNCVIDFSYGILNKYHLSISDNSSSSYIIIQEKLLMLNPARFGGMKNTLIDGYFIDKMHPEIAYDFFYGNIAIPASNASNCIVESLLPATVEKRDNVFVLTEKGKIFIRK